MSNSGGAFFGKQLPPKGGEDSQRVKRQNALIWGRATYDADDKIGQKKRVVKFVVKYGEEPIKYPPGYQRKRGEPLTRGKFMKCIASGQNACMTVMRAVEKGDMVLCLGRAKFETFRNGKVRYNMSVDLIIPFGVVDFMLRLSDVADIQKMLKAWENAPPDETELDF